MMKTANTAKNESLSSLSFQDDIHALALPGGIAAKNASICHDRISGFSKKGTRLYQPGK
jgi:hypothetical protein